MRRRIIQGLWREAWSRIETEIVEPPVKRFAVSAITVFFLLAVASYLISGGRVDKWSVAALTMLWVLWTTVFWIAGGFYAAISKDSNPPTDRLPAPGAETQLFTEDIAVAMARSLKRRNTTKGGA